jgi:hypothetical protein
MACISLEFSGCFVTCVSKCPKKVTTFNNWVKKSGVRNKKVRKETTKGAQHVTLLTKLQGKKTPSPNHVPCTTNVTDADLVKSAMTIDDKLFISNVTAPDEI